MRHVALPESLKPDKLLEKLALKVRLLNRGSLSGGTRFLSRA